MKKFVTGALLIAGVINFYPLVGAFSVNQLESLYGMPFEDGDLIILMRHRAVLFGLVGSFIIYSAFHSSIQTLACLAGLVSMVAFITLAYASGDFGVALNKVIIADIVGSAALASVLVVRMNQKGSGV